MPEYLEDSQGSCWAFQVNPEGDRPEDTPLMSMVDTGLVPVEGHHWSYLANRSLDIPRLKEVQTGNLRFVGNPI